MVNNYLSSSGAVGLGILPLSPCCISPFTSFTRCTRSLFVTRKNKDSRETTGLGSTQFVHMMPKKWHSDNTKEYFIHKTRSDCNKTDQLFLKELLTSDPLSLGWTLMYLQHSTFLHMMHKPSEHEGSLGSWPWFIGTNFLGLLRTIHGVSRHRTWMRSLGS